MSSAPEWVTTPLATRTCTNLVGGIERESDEDLIQARISVLSSQNFYPISPVTPAVDNGIKHHEPIDEGAEPSLAEDKTESDDCRVDEEPVNFADSGFSAFDGDVAYDLFTSSTPNGANEYEIMIGLAALGGAKPITKTGSPVGSLAVGGVTFDLYQGLNGNVPVFSFVAKSPANTFVADLVPFIKYVVQNNGLPSTQYLTTLECGTEPSTASNAKLTVSHYSAQVN